MDYFGNREVNDWLSDKTRQKGCTQKNLEYIRELKEIERLFKRNTIILYTLLKRFHMTGVNQMFQSQMRVKGFIKATQIDLKQYKVDPKWDKVFTRDFQNLRKRCDHVFFIIGENIRYTENYPFFKAVGFERLIDFAVAYPKDNESCAEQLVQEIEEWNSAHQDEIAAYMESVRPEIEAYEAHRKKVKEDAAMEKKIRKDLRKQQKAYEDEIIKNRKKEISRQKRIDRSFERYYQK